MCQTATINHSLVRLNRRSFNRRINFVTSPAAKERTALARLNGSLDGLYELLYENYPTVTEEDYKSFGPYLQILIETLSGLKSSYEKSAQAETLATGIEALGRNISALTEMDSDIRNFRIKIKRNERFQSLRTKIVLTEDVLQQARAICVRGCSVPADEDGRGAIADFKYKVV